MEVGNLPYGSVMQPAYELLGGSDDEAVDGGSSAGPAAAAAAAAEAAAASPVAAPPAPAQGEACEWCDVHCNKLEYTAMQTGISTRLVLNFLNAQIKSNKKSHATSFATSYAI